MASHSFARAGSLSPADAEIWSGQVEALSHLKRYGEAITACEKALALVPDDGNVWSQYAGVLRANQRFDDALAALERALALAPENLQSLDTQAGLLCERGRIAEGHADVYPRLAPTCEWDTGAAHAVLEGAGGHVVDVAGVRLRYGKSDVLNPHFVASSVPLADLHPR